MKRMEVKVERKGQKRATKQETVIEFLTEVYHKFSHLPRTDRILSYMNFFCQNFDYDAEVRDSYLSKDSYTPETFKQNETALFNFVTKKKGVCMQFSQALALLSVIDNSFSNDMPSMNYAAGLIKTKEQGRLGHAINLIFSREKEPIVIDISSMIHARDGQFKQKEMSFGMVYLDEYIANLKKERVEFLPIENGQCLQCFDCCNSDANSLYEFLNQPFEKLTKKQKTQIFYYKLPKKLQKN